MKKILLAILLLGTVAALAAEPSSTKLAKVNVCAACHGPTGISSNPEWPNLAGQHADYLLKQLNDFKENSLKNSPIMQAIVATLSPQEMIDLANYYANQPIAEGATPKEFLERGELLYRGGDFAKHIPACSACHGPRGIGNSQANFPVLSGQHAAYTLLQLQAFKNKQRANDLNGIMRDISARMSLEDMEAVANYVQGLH